VRSFLYSFAAVAAVFPSVKGAELTVSKRLVTEATDYGLKHADTTDEKFLSQWLRKPKNVAIMSVDNASIATIFTPFMQFAYFAHGSKHAPNDEEMRLLIKSVQNTINFRVLCFGKTRKFPNSARVELHVFWTEGGVRKSKVLKPKKNGGTVGEKLPPEATFADGSQAYGGVVFCSFDKSGLAGNETLLLKVTETSRNVMLAYEFDLEKVK